MHLDTSTVRTITLSIVFSYQACLKMGVFALFLIWLLLYLCYLVYDGFRRPSSFPPGPRKLPYFGTERTTRGKGHITVYSSKWNEKFGPVIGIANVGREDSKKIQIRVVAFQVISNMDTRLWLSTIQKSAVKSSANKSLREDSTVGSTWKQKALERAWEFFKELVIVGRIKENSRYAFWGYVTISCTSVIGAHNVHVGLSNFKFQTFGFGKKGAEGIIQEQALALVDHLRKNNDINLWVSELFNTSMLNVMTQMIASVQFEVNLSILLIKVNGITIQLTLRQ